MDRPILGLTTETGDSSQSSVSAVLTLAASSPFQLNADVTPFSAFGSWSAGSLVASLPTSPASDTEQDSDKKLELPELESREWIDWRS